jgi:hypothetical protein
LKGVKRGWHAVPGAPGIPNSADFAAVAANRKPVPLAGRRRCAPLDGTERAALQP